MDLHLLHETGANRKRTKRFDRLNSKTSFFACRMLEWIGWYNMTVPLRLLGHYRQFHIYKKRRRKNPDILPPIQGYILQYRASENIRRNFYLLISRIPSLFGTMDESVEMHVMNKLLISERAAILHEFLTNADTDFEQALKTAVDQIKSTDFISIPSKIEKETTIKETNTREIIVKEAATKEIIIKETIPAKELAGKEKDVFSKRQVLLLFDLLAKAGKLNPIDLRNHDKHPQIARFFHALTGKSNETWLELLKDYHDNDLYSWNTEPERSNLIAILQNLSDIAHDAGLRSISGQADSKIQKLRKAT